MAVQGFLAPKEGSRRVCRVGMIRALLHPLCPRSAAHSAGNELLNQECPESWRGAVLPGRFIKQTPHEWFSAPALSPWQWELSPPHWGGHFPAPMLDVCGHVVMDVLLAKDYGVVEVSKCALFLEGTLNKKCAEKWFGRRFGLEELCFPSV